jgi:hypothetical protein
MPASAGVWRGAHYQAASDVTRRTCHAAREKSLITIACVAPSTGVRMFSAATRAVRIAPFFTSSREDL